MLKISNPLPMFFDTDRLPLEDGKIYIGEAGADPEVAPVDCFWDSALTIPAAQPLRTISGLIVNDATPAPVYIAEDDYSQRVRTADDVELQYSAAVLPAGQSYQPLDDDLTEIAGQVNTDYGLQLLTLAGSADEGEGITLTKDADDNITEIAVNQTELKPTESLIVAASDETTALTTGTAKITFRMPYAFALTAIRASLSTAQTGGSIFTVDVNEGGVSILSTKLTIDNGEKTSTTAATAAVISDATLADDAEITIDIDQIGDGTAKGLKVTFIGRRP